MSKLKTILLIDDDPVTNFLNERLIKKLNLAQEILVAQNGEEGMFFLNSRIHQQINLPELIFLDLKMPVMDGFEFIEHFFGIQEDIRKKTKIIVLTTSQHAADKERLIVSGFKDIMNKPLSEKALISIFEEKFSPLQLK